jgi:hypothetical protein
MSLTCPKFHNPADYTYYELAWRYYGSWNIQLIGSGNYLPIAMDDAGDNMAYVDRGTNANTLSFHTTPDAGVNIETTDNIAADITANHVYKIQIKNGQIRFLIDDVVKATHVTHLFYNVPAGIFTTFQAVINVVGAVNFYFDYFTVRLGRAF